MHWRVAPTTPPPEALSARRAGSASGQFALSTSLNSLAASAGARVVRRPESRVGGAEMGKDKDKIKISKKKEKSVRVQPCGWVGAHVGGTS